MNPIKIRNLLKDQEGIWREILEEDNMKYQNLLFPELEGLTIKLEKSNFDYW
jgi:hypothetical protein